MAATNIAAQMLSQAHNHLSPVRFIEMESRTDAPRKYGVEV
jgi:hypothetical protein